MLYTGKTRLTSKILAAQSKILCEDKLKRNTMTEMVNLVKDFKKELIYGEINNLGEILHENWIRKRSITDKISNTWIDDAYQTAINNGASGGKILGAGNGGFFLFFAHPSKHKNIIEHLPKMDKFDFSFDDMGSQLVYSD